LIDIVQFLEKKTPFAGAEIDRALIGHSPGRFQPTYAGANMGQPYGAVETGAGLRGGSRYPTSREKRARCPEFPVRSSGKDRVCAFH